MSELKTLKLEEITPSPVALRNVNEESEKFLSLVDSVKSRGVINPISVRDTANGYVLLDGLHRYTAAKRAGLDEIDVKVIEASEAEVLELQIITNVQKIDTKPVEYAKQLQRMLSVNPMMLMSELAAKINKSSQWISERFNLLKLDPEVQELVDNDELILSNAYALARLPDEEERKNYLDRAMTLPAGEFVPLVEERIRDIRKANREGRAKTEPTFTAVPTSRKMSEIKEEYEAKVVGPKICSAEGLSTPAEGFAAAIDWVLRMDTESINEARAKWEARQQAMKEAKEARKVKAAKEKAEKAAAKAAELAEKVEAESANTEPAEPVV